jgi:hypothetical protein
MVGKMWAMKETGRYQITDRVTSSGSLALDLVAVWTLVPDTPGGKQSQGRCSRVRDSMSSRLGKAEDGEGRVRRGIYLSDWENGSLGTHVIVPEWHLAPNGRRIGAVLFGRS